VKCLYFWPFDVIPAKPDLKSYSRKLLNFFNLLFFLEMIISTLSPGTLVSHPVSSSFYYSENSPQQGGEGRQSGEGEQLCTPAHQVGFA
jgi:hypothetical protein